MSIRKEITDARPHRVDLHRFNGGTSHATYLDNDGGLRETVRHMFAILNQYSTN